MARGAASALGSMASGAAAVVRQQGPDATRGLGRGLGVVIGAALGVVVGGYRLIDAMGQGIAGGFVAGVVA